MSLLGRALRGAESRDVSGLAYPSATLTESLTGGRSYSGRPVGVDNSLTLVAVYSAVDLLSGQIGSLPLIVYRRLEGDGRERAQNHRAWTLLHDQPNPAMAADECWSLVSTHLLLWGNAFLAKVRDSLGIVRELWPIRPNRVVVGLDQQGRYYLVDVDGVKYRETDILHIRGLGTDGLVGLSPIQQARQMLAGAMEMEEFTGRFWGNGAMPTGVLTHPNSFKNPVAAKRIKDDFIGATSGTKRGSLVVLEEGMDYKTVSLPLQDQQFLETMQFNNLQVALLFRVPPSKLGAKTGDSLTYTTTELEGIDFVTYSLRRWLVRIESSLQRDPSIFVQGQRFYSEFLADALMRGATKDRYDAYSVALDPAKGWMRRAEVRDREGLAPETPDQVPQPAPAPPPADQGAAQ